MPCPVRFGCCRRASSRWPAKLRTHALCRPVPAEAAVAQDAKMEILGYISDLLRPTMVGRAASIPEQFNIGQYFVERSVDEGRGDVVAVFYSEERLTNRRTWDLVNR